VDILVQPRPSVTITGSYDCMSGMANLTLTVAGNGPVSGVLQPGNIAFSGTAPGTITIPPMAIAASTTYNVSSLTVGSCSASGAGLGSPLTISTLGTGPAGLWTGAVDTDWFNKCNWANYQVPDNTVDVTIDNSAVRICVIDPDTSPFAATYNDIARSRNITISNNQLQFASDAGKLSYLYAAGNLTINGATGYLNMEEGGHIDLAGNWTNNRGTLGFDEGLGTIQLMGTTQQTVQTVLGATEDFHNLIINNTLDLAAHNEVVMNSPTTIDGVFTLIDGHVQTTAANLLTVNNPAVNAVVGGAVNSYVNGPMARNTNSAADYNYPVGKPNGPYTTYRPAIIAPATTAPTVYRTEYMVQATNPTALAPRTMLGILNTEYWDISRTSGTADAIVKLNYINPNNNNHWADAGPCFDCNVAIAKTYPTPPPQPPAPPGTPPPTWYFTNYINTSSGFNMTLPETRWNGDNGLIWSKLLDNFGLFTFAYDYNVVLGHPQLPVVKLNAFNATLVGKNGELDWNIAGVSNLESVVLEHSTDGVQYSRLAAFGATLYGFYNYTHAQLSHGKHYYRLRVVDKQRQFILSDVRILEVARARTIIHDLPITVIRTIIPVDIESATDQQVSIRIVTVAGVALSSSAAKLEEGANRIGVQVPYLSQGIYFIQLTTEDGVRRVMKFMKE
ncbi:MAG TPA: T9SS type A sorting domain-containing protein, partial [Phnomibacter sp.]|nr:T9SS type A sorting domain-containing protein [Phnomibacter sp.]